MKKYIKDFFKNSYLIRIFVSVVLAVLFFGVFVILNNRGLSRPLFYGLATIAGYIISVVAVNLLMSYFRSRRMGIQKNEMKPILGNITLDLIVNMCIPVLICDENGRVIWCNKAFSKKSGKQNILYGDQIENLAGVPISVISDEDNEYGIDVNAFNSWFKVTSYRIESHGKPYCLTIWNDRTDVFGAYKRLSDESTLVAYIMIDNADELHYYVQDKAREASASIALILKEWATSIGAILKEYEREKFVMLFNASHLEAMIESRFEILDKIRETRVGEGNLPLTVSIGIANIDGTLSDKERAAAACLDMALQRGGDQVVLKTGDSMDFYGGKTKTVQKRTKVRARVIASELTSHMAKSSNVLIMAHKNIDFDGIGAAIGVARLAMFCGVRVNIVVNKNDSNFKRCYERLASIPEYRDTNTKPIFIGSQEALDLLSPDTLLVIVDTNNKVQYEIAEIADIAQNVVIIDHHRKAAEFANEPLISYIETSVSSTCELVSEILEQALPSSMLLKEEADILYAGILLDTKQFTRNTGVRTFSSVLYLRGEGASPADAQELFKTNLDDFIYEAKFESNVKMYRDNFAISVGEFGNDENIGNIRIAAAKAADKLLSVDSVIASFAVCSVNDVIHISARSAGTVNVQLILEKLNGGGHFDSAATQLRDITSENAVEILEEAIDTYLKENHIKI